MFLARSSIPNGVLAADLQIVDQLLGLCLVAQHGGKARGVLLHRGVVGNTVLHGFGYPRPIPAISSADSLDPANDRLSSKIGFEDIPEDAGLAGGVIEFAAEFVDFAGELVRTTGRVFDILRIACRYASLSILVVLWRVPRSMSLSVAVALLSWIRQFWVRELTGPKGRDYPVRP